MKNHYKKFPTIKWLIFRTSILLKTKGILFVMRKGIKIILNSLIFQHFYNKFKAKKNFTFQGTVYKYLYHWYGTTWDTERAIEVPIIWEIVNNYAGKDILEVGNVLSHYYYVNHDIIDKYEITENVINRDIVNYKSPKLYDLIISISTLEHVGWDEIPREPMKIYSAIENLKSLIKPDGMIVVTLPLGYNSILDDLLKKEKIDFTRLFFFKRISGDNDWKQVDWEDVYNVKYGEPFHAANGVVIGVIKIALS